MVSPSAQPTTARTLDNHPQDDTPRISTGTRDLSEFVRPPTDAASRYRPPEWPTLSTNKTPRKISDFGLRPKASTPPNLPTATHQRFAPPAPTNIASALSRFRVSPVIPPLSTSEIGPGPSHGVAMNGDSHANPMGPSVHKQQYIKVDPASARLSAFPWVDTSAHGAARTMAFSDSIKGRLFGERPTPSPTDLGPMEEEGVWRPASLLLPLLLSDIVQGVPFEKKVVGARIPGARSTVVVQVEPNRFHASHLRHDPAGQVTFEWLDPDVPEDARLIDRFREIRHQVEADVAETDPTNSVRNVVHQPEAEQIRSGKTRPLSVVSDDACRIFTSEQAQRTVVEGSKASLSRRELFNAERDDFDLTVYRTVLGSERVFETGGEWNIGNPAGVADLKASLRENNFAFATADTTAGRKVYFSLSGGARTDGLKLAIHDSMGEADEIRIGHLTFIDARRRLAKYTRSEPGTSSGSGVQTNLPVLDTECNTNINRRYDAGQILAAIIAHEAREHPLTGSIHVNTLLDTRDSCAGTLGMLQTQTKQSVRVVYHSDYGVTAVNSRNPVVRVMQEFGASINELHGHLITGNYAQMYKTGLRLPTPEMLAALTDSLLGESGSYMNATQLGIFGNGHYLRVLGVLTRTEVVRPDNVTDALLSPEGRAYVSMLGRRVAANPMLAQAWASLLHELKEAGVPRGTLLEVMLSKPTGSARCFYVELLRAPHAPRDGRDPLVAWLKEAHLVPGIKELSHYVSLRRALTLATRLRIQIQPTKCLEFNHVPLKKVLVEARDALSMSALNAADNQRLANRLREVMPTITVGEQREFREMIHDTLNEAWQKVLPNTQPASHIAQSLIEDLGPSYGSALIGSRKAAVDAIIAQRTAAYADFQQRNPTATQKALRDVFEAQVQAAREAYRAVLSGASATASENLTASASQAAQSAKTTLARQKIRQQAEDAALAARNGAAAAAQSRAEQASSRAAKNAAGRQAKQMALDAARAASLQAYTEACKASKQKVETQLKHEVSAQVRRDAATRARQSAAQQARQSALAMTRNQFKQEAAAQFDRDIKSMYARLNALRANPTDQAIQERLDALRGIPSTSQIERRFANLRSPQSGSNVTSSGRTVLPAP
ncbi:hypothetical protein [Pandoraea sputorum]|nr:hypothetical protein [Pandoraea sputorum]